jgi:hypothetical protein
LEKNFATVAETFKLVTYPMARQSAMRASVPRALKRDPSGTWAAIHDKLSGRDQSYAFRQVVLAQVQDLNWRGAIQTQMAIEKGHDRTQAILDIGRRLATADLDLALSWREQLTGDDQKHAHMHILDALSEARDDTGLERLLAVTPLIDDARPGGYLSWERDRMIIRIVLVRLDGGDTAGIARLRDRLPGNEQDLVDAVVISSDETIPPALRMAQLAQLKSNSARSNGIMRIVAREWTKDPEQTKSFVLSLPEGTFGEAVAVMIRKWEDKLSLSEWIKRLDAGFKREGAILAFARSAQGSRSADEKALAREVAAWASNPDTRQKLQRLEPEIRR